MTLALRIYRRLARAFPHEFKLAYGREVMQLGEDVVNDIASRYGTSGLFRLLADIAVRVPIEYLSALRRDMHYGLRALRKSPGFAFVGAISMGLAIGLATNIYSSKWQVISRELPAAANAKRLVMSEKPVSYYYIEQYREQKNLLAGVAAFQNGIPLNVKLSGDLNARTQRVFGQLVSPDYFSVLGVHAQRGRVLSADLDKTGGEPAVVISDSFWRNRLNSSPDAVGQRIHLNGQIATIVGITPKGFNGVLPDTHWELFVPITVPAVLAPELANDVLHQRNAREFGAVMCLAPGVAMETAEGGLDGVTHQLDLEGPAAPPASDKSRRITLLDAGVMTPLPRGLKPVVMGFFAVLMGLIVAIACMNLANMLLARAANRGKELAIRISIGASRFRLIRQLMSEGILLSLLGGAAGFPLAYCLAALRTRFSPPAAIPVEVTPLPDWHAGVFVFVLAMVCGIGFSLVPALRATRADVTPALKEGPALPLAGHRRFGLRNLLVVMQVAGSLTLLLITGFLVVGISQVSRVETKFDPATMVLFSLDPVRDGYTAEKAKALFEQLSQRLGQSGAVQSVTLAAQAPFSLEDQDDPQPFVTEDAKGGRIQISALKEAVGARYFSALGEPMLAGREFLEQDQRRRTDPGNEVPAVLNESAARALFAGRGAIGERFKDDGQSYEVVGVVHDLSTGLGFSRSVVYAPLTERNFARPQASGITIMVRAGAAMDAMDSVRNQLTSANPDLNVFNVRSLSEELQRSRSSNRFAVETYGGIGVFGLVLAAIGLAGITAYTVAQRRKEIGIRMALGSRKGQVLWLVLRDAVVLVLFGTALGILGAFAVTKMLSTLVNFIVDALGVGTRNLSLMIGAPLLLAAVTMLACYLPARKAATVDPLKALREA